MNAAFVFCIIVSQCFFAFGGPGFAPKGNGQTGTTTMAGGKRVWRAATYRGLTMGSSHVAEMLRLFGPPKKTETFDEASKNPEVWYHYEGQSDFPGTLRVIVDEASYTVRAVDLLPTDLKQEEAIKYYGPDYIVTRYDFDSCLGNEEAAPLFESPKGNVVFVEYRQRGIAIAVNGQGNVNDIRYVSEPIGAESSKCK